MPVYTNAADVLPPDLLTEVQKRWQGLLYVPPPERRSKADSELVFNLINGGCTATETAMVAGVTRRRVYQIAGKLGTENPFARTKPRIALTVNDGTNDGRFRHIPVKRAESPLKRGKTRTTRK